VEQKASRLFPWLSSLPEGGSGGCLLSNSLTPHEKHVHLKVFFEFIDTHYSHSHSFITLKEHLDYEHGSSGPSPLLYENGLQWLDTSSTNLPCIHVIKLGIRLPFEEKNYFFPFNRRMRKKIRLVQKTGYHVITDHNLEYLDDFVEMQVHLNKKLGFVGNKDEIIQISKVFHDKIKLFIGLLDAQPISAQYCFSTPKTFYLSKGPYLPVAYDYLTNTLPICAAIQYAWEHGYEYVDMGKTHSPDLAFYKEQFGAMKIPQKIYSKRFSQVRFVTNKLYGLIMD
jgi:hypothetical protein